MITQRVIVKVEIAAFKLNICFLCNHCNEQGCISRYNRFMGGARFDTSIRQHRSDVKVETRMLFKQTG